MTHNVVASKDAIDEWRVEAIDYMDDGQIYVTIFSGPSARERALEYALWKNGSDVESYQYGGIYGDAT